IQPAASYVGIDRDPAAARANAPDLSWVRGDAARLSGPVDRILTNPPWDRQVRLGGFRPYLRAWRKVLTPAGRVVAILNHPQADTMIGDAGWQLHDIHDVSVAGQHPRIVVAKPT